MLDTIRVNEIDGKGTSSSTELYHAKALLYESYVQHLSWEILSNNPSNIEIHQFEDKKTLSDDYDKLSLWFSVTKQQALIACARLCTEDENGLLEIERYDNARKALANILQQKTSLQLIEMNREAILPQYALHRELYGLLLLKKIFTYCMRKEQAILTTSNIPDWVFLYNHIEWSPLSAYAFKYCDRDPLPVHVYLALPENYPALLHKIDSCLEEYT